MENTTVPLYDKYKSSVEFLWKATWPERLVTDFEISWKNRDTSTSCAILDKRRFLGFVISSKHKANRGNLYIDYIALKEECKGKGLGSRILRDYVVTAYKNGGSVHLWPEKSELVGWYTRQGFSPSYDGYYNFHSYKTRNQYKIHKSLSL
jgi:ribosomal protein S18 acetylase RimI-like enzyme